MTDTWGPRTAGRPFANHECIPMIVILHLGSHSGRGHPICSPFSKGGVPLFNPGRLNAPVRPQAFSTTKKNTQTGNTRTHRHSLNHTPPSPEQGRLPPPLPPVARPMVIVGTHGCGQGRVSIVCERKYLPAGTYCTVSE